MAKNWAIAIGINQYRNLQPLQFAVRDADAMQSFFQQDLNIQPVYHFTDNSPTIPQDYGFALDSTPTYATLRRFFRVRFEEPFLRPGDNLWFFFAGHGKRHDEQDYLMPIDADPGDDSEKSTWIPLRYITDRLRRSGADNIVMLIDACRSGDGRRDSSGFGQEKQQGVITLFACSPWESSYEIDQLQHGAFTHALLQGLQIEGEGNCATVERLYQRLRQTVPQVTQQYKRVQQTPYGVVEPPTKYHLILLPRKANLSDIMTLRNDALQAEVKREFKLAKQLWIRVLAASPADHDAIEGIERLALVSATPVPETPAVPPPPATGQCATTPSPSPKIVISTFWFDVVTVNAQGQEVNRKPGEAQNFTDNLGNGVTLNMVSIPGGSFQMGAPNREKGWSKDEKPQHPVTIKSFLMGRYPVTQAQWKAVTAFPKVNQDLNPNPSHFKGENLPAEQISVEQISWHDAMEFCDRLSKRTGRDYRLPSEAEWEYACRASPIQTSGTPRSSIARSVRTSTPFHFGKTITTSLANYRGTDWEYQGKTYPGFYGTEPKGIFREKTTAVGSFPLNAFGLYDMHGNVWEWCLDHWHDNYRGAPSDGTAWIEGGDSSFRLLRGGSWYDCPARCRSAYRGGSDPSYRYDFIGFRVVCDSPWTL